jgi:predicted amidophosphoribosyltransferase
MPLHRTRERARGYNQSVEIARRLSASLGARLHENGLHRTRSTRAQADLDHAERGANVVGAFRAAAARSRSDPTLPDRRRGLTVSGRRCLLVDDVATTGHTLLEALRALDHCGPSMTGAAVFALA